jgi:hypothetical protein
MVGQDFAIVSPEALPTWFETVKGEAQGQTVIAAEGDAAVDVDPDEIYYSSVDENGIGFFVLGEPHNPSAAALKRLQRQELDMFAADSVCANSSKVAEIRRQIEDEFATRLAEEFPGVGLDANP